MDFKKRCSYLEADKKRVVKFIQEEKRLKEEDDRHTDRFKSGFVSACNIILDQLK